MSPSVSADSSPPSKRNPSRTIRRDGVVLLR
jgi:hypothetical protein